MVFTVFTAQRYQKWLKTGVVEVAFFVTRIKVEKTIVGCRDFFTTCFPATLAKIHLNFRGLNPKDWCRTSVTSSDMDGLRPTGLRPTHPSPLFCKPLGECVPSATRYRSRNTCQDGLTFGSFVHQLIVSLVIVCHANVRIAT